MTYFEERLAKKRAEKLSKKIVEYKKKELLDTGRRFILLSTTGVPLDTITAKEAVAVMDYIKEHEPSDLDKVTVHDILYNKEYTGSEVLVKFGKVLW